MKKSNHGELKAAIKKILDDHYNAFRNGFFNFDIKHILPEVQKNVPTATAGSIRSCLIKQFKSEITITDLKNGKSNIYKYVPIEEEKPITKEIEKEKCLTPFQIGEAILAYINHQSLNINKIKAEVDALREQLKLERSDWKCENKKLKEEIEVLKAKLQSCGNFPLSEVARFIKR